MKYKSFSNLELDLRTESNAQVERESAAEAVRLFQEIHARKLYLQYSYPSLFEMAVKRYGYCAASAMRRINAMRLSNELPEVQEKIESGELSLSVVNELQTYFQQEKRADRAYSVNAKIELVEASIGKSRREVEQAIAKRNPERSKPDTVHAISEDRSRMNLSVSNRLVEKLNKLRDLRSNANPDMTYEELLDELAEIGLDRFDPARKAERARLRKEKQAAKFNEGSLVKAQTKLSLKVEPELGKIVNDNSCISQTIDDAAGDSLPPAEVKSKSIEVNSEAPRTRHVPAEEKHQVTPKPCCFVDEKTGRRCNATKFLQLDHVHEFAKGGENKAHNLRWMCGAHNRYRSQEQSGVH